MMLKNFTTIIDNSGKNVYLLVDLKDVVPTTESKKKIIHLSQNPERVISFFSKSVWLKSELEGESVLVIYANPMIDKGGKSFQIALIGIHDEVWEYLNTDYRVSIIPVGHDVRIDQKNVVTNAIEILKYQDIEV